MLAEPAELTDTRKNLTGYRPPGTGLTLSGLLRFRAAQQPNRIAYRIVKDSLFREDVLTYLGLHERALAIASYLQAENLSGKRIVLLHQTGVEFLASFFGALYAGSIAVPLNPPWTASALERLNAIFSDIDAAAVLTTQPVHARILQSSSKTNWSTQQTFIYTESLTAAEDDGFVDCGPFDLAVIQYTSGSTSTPKGVELSHYNFLHNASLMAHASDLTADSVGVNWLPLFHDMGLMGGVIQPISAGFPIVLLSPAAFLARPVLWLQAITRYHATVSGAPDFGYSHCVEMINDDLVQNLDLRKWQVAYSGAEPVRADTLDRFARRFSGCGFDRRAFFPCYGLAEATLIVSGGPTGIEPVILDASRRSLERNKTAVTALDQSDVIRLVSSGRPIGDQTVIIVDPDTRLKCDQGKVGEIWLRGRSVGSGYRNQVLETKEIFRARYDQHDDFLRTGDLGFLHDGNLFVVGRIKDLIIVHGVNHFPHDIELAAGQSHSALRAGSAAAFAVENDGREGLAVVHEVKRTWSEQDAPAILDGIRKAIVDQHGIVAYAIVLVAHGTLQKTTSGKIQRHSARDAFASGKLKVLAEWRLSEASNSITSDKFNPDEDELAKPFPDDLHGLLGDIWSEVLNVRDIGIEENFFDLGGQSAQLVSVNLKLNEILNAEVPVTKLFQHPTIRSLSSYLRTAYIQEKRTLRDPERHDGVRNRLLSRQRYYQLRLAQRKTRGIS
jgi:acyl-CoA synthetase (AMP-forming)/AMP-acid ligase II